MCALAAEMMSRIIGHRVETAVTLRRQKYRALIAGSSADGILLEETEQGGDKGCDQGIPRSRTHLTVKASDEVESPTYAKSVDVHDSRSVISTPLALNEGASAILHYFAPLPATLTQNVLVSAQDFAHIASHALRLALRVARAGDVENDLRAALEGRTVIDLACGMIMAQEHCSKERAFDILRRGANNRNQKVRVLAEHIVARTAGTGNSATHFDP